MGQGEHTLRIWNASWYEAFFVMWTSDSCAPFFPVPMNTIKPESHIIRTAHPCRFNMSQIEAEIGGKSTVSKVVAAVNPLEQGRALNQGFSTEVHLITIALDGVEDEEGEVR